MATKKSAPKDDEQDGIEVEDIFDEGNKPQSNYFKFGKVGDRISGELLEVEDRPAKDQFGESRVFTLRVKNGDIWLVSISKAKTFVIQRASRAAIGDTLGFSFDEEIKSATKGFAPAKSISVYLVKAAPKDESEDEEAF